MKLFKIMETAYENFDNTIRSYLSKTFNSLGMQYTHSQIFGVIFDGIKGVIQNMMFYIEDAFTEQNIFTASRKKSVYALAKLSGYEPYYGSAATGTLISKSHVQNTTGIKSTKIYIKNGTSVTNTATGITYAIILPTEYYVIDISKPLMTHEFKIAQGVFKKNSYIGKGMDMESIHISSYELFDKQYIEITVDGEIWEPVENMYDMTNDSKQYIITVGYDNTFDICFGNGIYGRKLKEGQTVIIKYLSHVGVLGNVLTNENTEFLFKDICYDSLGESVNANNYIKLSMKNCISGGTNSDTIEFVRGMVGKNSRSLVLATEDNFKLFFKRFSFIGYVNCWSETNSMTITATCLKNVNNEIKEIEDYYNLKVNDLLLNPEQKDMVVETLNHSKKAFAGVTLNFEDPVIRKFAFICYIKPDNVYNKDLITCDIKNVLAKYFMNTLEDKKFIAKSDLINIITASNKGILAADIDIISDLAEQTYKNGYYEKYDLEYINGTYKYVSKKVIYEKETIPGLDYYGNISLNSNLEIPLLHGGFNYYPEKENNSFNSYKIPTIQVIFI